MWKSRARPLLAAAGISVIVFLGLQLIRPRLENPPVTADLVVPAPVKQILRRSCYDCHSNETRIPWFDRVVPAYWLVVRDVTEGRRQLNFSEAGGWPAARQKAALFESINHIVLGAMPPRPYLALRRNARIGDEDLATFKQYLLSTVTKPGRPKADEAHATLALAVRPAPNGIAVPADYPQWQTISGTERFDSGTLRAVLGNPTAVKAVEHNAINPWPDGAALAKVAWTTVQAANGTTRAGDFWQLEVMLKNRAMCASTEGWGFARWRGVELRPYGKDASFAQECVGCHAPLKSSDFVFTQPIQRGSQGTGMNQAAALPSSLSFAPLAGSVLSVFVDPTRATFSLLQGNDIATRHARAKPTTSFPDGSILALVTWSEMDDSRWFGARLPGPVQSVDILRRQGNGDEASWVPEVYERSPASSLEKVPANGTPESWARMSWLLDQHAAPIPSGHCARCASNHTYEYWVMECTLRG